MVAENVVKDGQTDGPTKYCNPRCACAPRVNKLLLATLPHISRKTFIYTSLPFSLICTVGAVNSRLTKKQLALRDTKTLYTPCPFTNMLSLYKLPLFSQGRLLKLYTLRMVSMGFCDIFTLSNTYWRWMQLKLQTSCLWPSHMHMHTHIPYANEQR